MIETFLPHLLFLLTWAVLWLACVVLPTLWKALRSLLRRYAPRLLDRPRVARAWERSRARMGPWQAYLPTMAILAFGIAATLIVGEDFIELAVSMRQQNPEVLNIDQMVYRWAASMRSSQATLFFVTFTHIGGPIGLAILALSVAGLLFLKKHRGLALYVVITGPMGGVLNILLKQVFARARPDLAEALRQAHGYSFPSGHAMGSMIVLGSLAYVMLRLQGSWRSRSAMIALLFTSVLTVGLSRVYLGVHWISDIAAGFAAGLIWLVIATVAFEAFWRIRRIRAGRNAVAATMMFLLLGCATAPPDTLGPDIDRILAQHPDQTIGVAYYDLDSGASLERNATTTFHAASTMKVPVMLGIFEAVTRGELRLDQPVMVRNEFTSILDGSLYALEAREDSDNELYEQVGNPLPLEELVRRMIVRSSNLATNLVIEKIGAPRVMTLMKKIGANDIRVLRGVEDDKAYHAGMNNTTTARDLMLILKALGEKRVVSHEASEKMLEILLAQEHNDGIPAGLPPGTRVAHKTGSITEIAHDAGLVLAPNGSRYVLVVLTRGFKENADADRVIAEISRAVWDSRSAAFSPSPVLRKQQLGTADLLPRRASRSSVDQLLQPGERSSPQQGFTRFSVVNGKAVDPLEL
ncbi:MAG TPA: serine hydrolase [Thermoanaerobaculia bacterium]|jgi:beta-lactamase class A|nr:serine hydrolase [Thermoanaerobaculia bacterium]